MTRAPVSTHLIFIHRNSSHYKFTIALYMKHEHLLVCCVLFVLMMDSSKSELDFEFLPSFRVYKDGTIERFRGTEIAPLSIDDPQTNVSSKDILISPESDLSVRLYLPKIAKHPHQNEKFPLLVYFHGGGFCVYTAFSPIYHNYLNSLVSEANIVVVSVNYRLAPEHPLPIAYEDSWNALQWVASHCSGKGTEAWLTDHVDFDEVFLGGDSAGANIAHHMAMRIGSNELVFNLSIIGVALVHPMFWGSEVIGSEITDPQKKAKLDRLWPIVSPLKPDLDDPWINPVADGAPSLSKLGCSKVLVCVAEKDVLRDRGRLYYESLSKCGWEGVAEIAETEGENHVFHLYSPGCEKAKDFPWTIGCLLESRTLTLVYMTRKLE